MRTVLLGGLQINSGDLIVADRNGVVVLPHAQINAVIGRLRHVAELDAALEKKLPPDSAIRWI